MMPSKKANHYGTLCERLAAERFNLTLNRSSWRDAELSTGTPVEIKSTMRQHADGQPGNFKLYSTFHRRLRANDGRYAFVVYRVRGRGVEPLIMKMLHSSRLPRLSWHGGGAHRDAQQAKVGITEIF